jgi:hypothetical protein
MAFAPGQFITAQRLNRLQSKTYWSQISGAITTVAAGADVTGTAISIPIETNGATAAFVYSGDLRAGASLASNINVEAFWDVNGSPNFALAEWKDASAKGVVCNVWATTVPTAGTYTFKLKYTNVANGSIGIYTSMMVTITEVA